MRGGFKRWAHFLLSFMLALVLLFELYIFIIVYTEGNVPLPANIGNFERVRALLVDNEQREEFSFAVVGDTKGTGTFECLAALMRDEPLSFVMLLGDCVRSGCPEFHQYFHAELAEELTMPCPTFYVVGNHDVSKNEFPISRFEEMYGPTNFYFDYQSCLFIVLRILDKARYSTKGSLTFLESTLSARRRNYKKVFIFIHIPPPVSADFVAKEFENSDKFVALCDKFKVDYVIAGDYHGYARVKRGDTTYLVTGGGGARLRKNKYCGFHHAIVIRVGKQQVSERILFTKEHEELEDMMESCAIALAYPWMKENWVATIMLNLGILAILFWTLRGFWRNRRTCRN